jgi:hypothetical protein
VLEKHAPAAGPAGVTLKAGSLEKALRELIAQLDLMRDALEQKRETEFSGGMTELRASIDRLAPVVAGIRDHTRAKVRSATA